MNTRSATSPLVISLMSSLSLAQAAGWEKIASLPEPAAGFAAGWVNGKIVASGGTNWRDGQKRWLDTVWIYNPASNEWDIGPKRRHPTAYAAFGSDGHRLFIAGGADGARARQEIYALDEKGKAVLIGDLDQPVVFGCGALQGQRLFIFGGMTHPDDWTAGRNNLVQVELVSGESSVPSRLETFPHPLGIPAVVSSGGSILSFTGAWVDDAKKVHNAVKAQAYNPAARQWQRATDYPEPIRGVAAVALDDNHIYLAGGYSSKDQDFVAKAWIYDVRTSQYTASTPLPLNVNTTFVKGGDFIYLLGGEDQMKHRADACWRIRIADLVGEP